MQENFNNFSNKKFFDHFTNRAKQVIKFAKLRAQYYKHTDLMPIHLLCGLLYVTSSKACIVFKSLDITQVHINTLLESLPSVKSKEDSTPYLSQETKSILEKALIISKSFQHEFITTEHISIALIDSKDELIHQALAKAEISPSEIKEKLLSAIKNLEKETVFATVNPTSLSGDERGNSAGLMEDSGKRPETINEKLALLKSYGEDLTELAREGKLDKVIGRSKEIQQAILVLMRRKKNNPLLKGAPGVGKTAIAEGLAQAIASGNVPEPLKTKHIISLDLPSMVAGTKYRGQFEEKIKSIVEAAKDPDIILFIDEIHTIVGAGSAEGAIDAGNIFKPSLAKGLKCIGATTDKEYREIEKDAALSRRFDVISVRPSTINETIEILKEIKPVLEEHHNCKYTDEAILEIPKITERYMSHLNLPDKAVDVMDEAGSFARLYCSNETSISSQESEIEELRKQKEEAIDNQDYELAVSIREKELNLRKNLANKTSKKSAKAKTIVDMKLVSKVISNKTGIPHSNITSSDTNKLSKLQEALKKNIAGQEHAVSKICQSIIRNRLGLRDPGRPAGSFLLLGPSGVGKTFLARTIADCLYDDPKALIRIDMSEYMEKFAVSRIIGSPPGYVGHDDSETISEKVRRKPYSVVLFDEIEKAHPEVLDILLQILEDGRLTDSSGRSVDFTHAIVILTSNIGSKMFMNTTMGLGKNTSTEIPNQEKISEQVIAVASKSLRPELINRFDSMIVFNQLTKDNLKFVANAEINKVKSLLKNQFKTDIHISKPVTEFIIDKGFNPKFGARSIRRVIQDELTTSLSKFLIDKSSKVSANLSAKLVDGKIVVGPYSKSKQSKVKSKDEAKDILDKNIELETATDNIE